jgi:hypothetical protein
MPTDSRPIDTSASALPSGTVKCGIYERQRPDGRLHRMVWPDSKPLPRWTRVGDADCQTQFDGGGILKHVGSRAVSLTPRPKVLDWLRAERSLLVEGPVSDGIYSLRQLTCLACPKRIVGPGGSIGFCDACGCGVRQRAELGTKLTMPKVSCPLGKWEESVGTHGTLRWFLLHAWFQARGIAGSLLMDAGRWVAGK